jgi:hypothetical protein
MNPLLKHVIIGNPENRRLEMFQSALGKSGLPPATLLPYVDLIDDPVRLAEMVDARTVVRIESPGENECVHNKLIALGAELCRPPAESITAQQARALPPDYGRVRWALIR